MSSRCGILKVSNKNSYSILYHADLYSVINRMLVQSIVKFPSFFKVYSFITMFKVLVNDMLLHNRVAFAEVLRHLLSIF